MNDRLSRSERGRWQFRIPWERAGVLQRKLARMGFPSTLILHQFRKEAYLEIPPEVVPEEMLLALTGSMPPLPAPTVEAFRVVCVP